MSSTWQTLGAPSWWNCDIRWMDLCLACLLACLIDCLIDWFIDWSIGWLVGWFVGWLAGWLVSWLVGWLVGWLIDCLLGWSCCFVALRWELLSKRSLDIQLAGSRFCSVQQTNPKMGGRHPTTTITGDASQEVYIYNTNNHKNRLRTLHKWLGAALPNPILKWALLLTSWKTWLPWKS